MMGAYDNMNTQWKSRGFTLIELMITVAIVGLLAAVGYPSYQQYMLRAHRTEGTAALQQAATLQERHFSNNSTYTTDVAKAGIKLITERSYYAISAAPCAGGTIATCYILTATAQGGQTADTGCTPLTLDSKAVKAPLNCW
jgi:type IV pilus assembly protein PilE